MIPDKRRIASAIDRFPFALRFAHGVWRLTRPHFTAGVIGVLFNSRGEVLVVEHVYHTHPRWGLPGGFVDHGEQPEETVVRELREELGIHVTVRHTLVIERAYRGHLDIAFLCQSDEAVRELSGELSDYRWALPDQLPEVRPFHHRAISEALVLMDVNV